jgi:hypothetical protein
VKPAITVTAARADGSVVTLEGLKSLRVEASLETPAVCLSAAFAPQGCLGREEIWRGVSVRHGNELLFEGAPDIKKDSLSAQGAITVLEARSAAAALLDNQARPGQMLNPTTATVFKHYVAPYGFNLLAPQKNPALPLYTIYAGMSEWEAFVGFVRRVHRVTPYVSGRAVIIQRPYAGAAPFRVSNKGGAAFSSLTREQIPYNIISSVYLRGPDGVYSSAMHNAAAESRGVRRKRFVTPPNEFMNDLRFDASMRIRRSMFLAEKITAELPGIYSVELGADAAVEDAALRAGGLIVAKKEYLLDESGLFTRLTLRNAMYYD